MIPVLRRDQQTKSPLFLFSPLFFSRSFLPYPSLKAQLQSFVTPEQKKSFFPGFPAGPDPTDFIWALPEEQEALWCHHISSVPLQCSLPLFLDNRFLMTEHRMGKNQSHVPVCVSVCVWKRQRLNENHWYLKPLLKIWIFLLSCVCS